jgi:hypothetical protein
MAKIVKLPLCIEAYSEREKAKCEGHREEKEGGQGSRLKRQEKHEV